jgi:hypothetical protein
MEEQRFEGRVTFVQYDKKFVTIEYDHNGKMKVINGSIKDAAQQKLLDEKLIKKFHHFREGDQVTFSLVRSVRGDKMVADRIRFQYNNSLDNLIQKARTKNEFLGYLKQVENDFFIKEIDSYHFFPLKLSPWEKRPTALNEPVLFALNNMSNPDKVTASLVKQEFTPEYKKAVDYYKRKTTIDAKVVRTTPHAVYVSIAGEVILGKLPFDEKASVGDVIQVRISFLSTEKLAVERVN